MCSIQDSFHSYVHDYKHINIVTIYLKATRRRNGTRELSIVDMQNKVPTNYYVFVKQKKATFGILITKSEIRN